MTKQRSQRKVVKPKKEAAPQKPSWYVGTVDEAAPWMLRPYIVRGYRIGFTRTWQSLFTWHNETSNVWSHLIGAALFFWFTVYVFVYMAVPRMPAFPQEWCPRLSPEAINQFLESNGIVNHPEPHSFHSGYNHHSEAFERLEAMIKASFDQLRNAGNLECLANLLTLVPTFITQSYEGQSFLQHKLDFFYAVTEQLRQRLLDDPTTSGDVNLIEHVPRWPLFAHLFCAISMLLFSAFYHNNYCKNEKTFNFLLTLDYVGIGVMIAGSAIPPFYYGFMCNLKYFYLVWGAIFGFCCLASLLMIKPKLFGLTDQSCQLGFVAFTCAGLIPLPAASYMNGYLAEIGLKHIDMEIWTAGGALYIIGGFIYAMHWPERFFVAKFDYIGNSHNIFHVCIVIAALLHWYGSIRVFHERQLYGCPAVI